MSNGFSWSKIIGKQGEEAEATESPTPTAPPVVSDSEVAMPDLPFGGLTEPPKGSTGETFTPSKAEADAEHSELQDILTQLKTSQPMVPPANAPKFEDIAPGEEKTFETTVDGGVPLNRGLSAEVNAEVSPEAPVDDPMTRIFGQNSEESTEEVPAESPEEAPLHSTPFDPEIHNMSLEVKENQVPGRELGSMRMASEGMRPVADIHIDEVLTIAVERKASDIHITPGLPPMARIDGEVVPLPYQPLKPEDCRRLIYEVLNDEKLEKYERTHELDFSYAVRDVGRFRFNVYMQRGAVSGAMRAIPTRIPDFETLGLPPIIRDVSKRSSGLVLVTGPTGSGKSTTIATMIDDINNNRKSHIITIEDPIEYLHTHKQCMVNQREMHSDTYSFHNALRAVLREDPDIILVGELRDLETIEAALTLAETGHLVFGTLHTRNAPSTIDRVIDVFPTDAQAQIKVLLSNTLEAVVSQQLLPLIGGGRCAAIEVMIATPAIKNLIREGKTHQMYSIIETSGSHGMQTMDSVLAELYRSAKCDWEECVMRSIDKETFSRLAKR